MPHAADIFDTKQKKTLGLLRIVWAALLAEIFVLGGLVYMVVASRPATAASTDPKLLAIALAGAFGGGALGYFCRMQAYKRHWVDSRIERQGYLTGNLILFALTEVGALIVVGCAYFAARPGQELLMLMIPTIILVINFPTGRAMLDDADRLTDRRA